VTDGAYPYAGLVQATDGNFYGTTIFGGTAGNCTPGGCGTVFKITPGGTLTTLHSFANTTTEGAVPYAGLVQATDGNFYGTTEDGGAYADGTVFSLSVGLGPFVETNPTSGPVGTPVVILGNNLTGATSVSFNGTAATFTVISSSEIQTTVPAGATTGKVTVVTPSGTLYSNQNFVVTTVAAVTFSPTSLNFGNEALNQTSAAKSVTVKNSGTATLTISGITISGDFAISANTCGATLAVGQKCKVSVTFTPTVLGALAGTLTFTDNTSNSPQTVALTGTGIEPATLTPATATYASQAEGTTSAAKTFTLTNDQPVALNNIVISTTGDFAVSATTCTTSLAAKGKCLISVTFAPTAAGARAGQLSVSDSASNSPQTVTLSGTGIVPATLTPASATYAPQKVGTTSAAKTFTLTNKQTVALTGIAISTYPPYAVSATTCTTSLAAKGKCTISVTFTPEAAESYETALFVYDSASNSPQTSFMLGTGK